MKNKTDKASQHALARAKAMQLKVETAVFDKAVKEHFDDWKGYANYDWTRSSNEDTKKGLEILNKTDSLDLSNSALLRLPKEVAECPNLKHINLLGNNDIDWQRSENTLSKLDKKVSIYVSVNDLSDINSTYWHLITGIEILQNQLQKIPENILQQKQLTFLDLSAEYSFHNTASNNFETLPTQLFELRKLKYLYLKHCNIRNLPPEIGNLTNLQELSNDLEFNVILQKDKNSMIINAKKQDTEDELVKIDFVKYPYPLIKEVIKIDGLRLLSVEDIIAMKLSAIASRGAKKDFFDIYELMKTYSISDMFKFFSVKFPKTAHFYILKSLTYFEDVEPEFDPISLNNTSWKHVKLTIEKKVTEYM